MARKRLHVVSNTHWDREHRHGFQETRMMLVETIDKLIGIMKKDPEFKHFIFDGQSVMIEDYLEVKPHMAGELKKLIADGRILVGPWYSLPDMPTVNPESIVRNLLMGDRFCRQFGNKMKFGYSIFSFGQIAQLPQIYAGFDIHDLIVYKNFSREVLPQSEYVWEASDGTKALASRLGEQFRVNFLFCFTIPVILGGDARKVGWNVGFTDGTRLVHMVDKHFAWNHARELEQPIHIREENIKQGIEDTLASVTETVAESTFLGFDGVDFSSPLAELPEALRKANEIFGDELDICHSTPVEYFKELRAQIDIDSLVHYKGEIRFAPMSKVHCEGLSANIELKQGNQSAENTVLSYAEPFSLFYMLNGGSYPYDILRTAWKYLFKSHAHDSIHGIGVPKIKRDTLYRIEQAQEIADSAARRAFEGLISQIDTSAFDDDDILITIFNPTPYQRTEVANLQLDLPAEENAIEYHLETLDARRLELYEHDRNIVGIGSVNGENRPKAVLCDRVDVDVLLEDIPAFGYKTVKLQRTKGPEVKGGGPFPNAIFAFDPIAQKPNILDNGLLRVEVTQNGTFKVTDLETGQTTEGLNLFVDTGCSGDMWIHREPNHNRVISSHGCQADIAIIKNSCLGATLQIKVVMNIPESLTADRNARSKHTIATEITTEITLSKGSKRLDCKVSFENRARDHKLSVALPTSIKADSSFSECAFEIRQRPISAATNDNGKIPGDILRHSMHGFLDISDGKNGMALFTKGIKEFETTYYEDGLVCGNLTLLRAVTQSFPIHADVFLNYEDEEAQCLGRHSFEYSLYFHAGDYKKGDVIAQSRIYLSDLVAGQSGKGQIGRLPSEVSFLKSSNRDVLIHCIKKAEDTDQMVIRLTNPTDKSVKECLTLYHNIKSACIMDMNENEIEPLEAKSGNRLEIDISPYKILTLAIDFPWK